MIARKRSCFLIQNSKLSFFFRVLSLTINSSQIEQILASIIGYLEENNQNPSIELRLLLHTNWCGSLIGKNGSKLKDIRQKNNTSVKIFPQCCPRSSERICIIQGQVKILVFKYLLSYK